MDGVAQSPVIPLASLAVGLIPVVLFLLALQLMDSFKLVHGRDVLISILAGGTVALIAYPINQWAEIGLHLEPALVRRYIAPLVEESLKAMFVIHLIRRERIGFMVDAGIHGFAVGTGFALLENVYYAWKLSTFSLAVWVVRGLGTAVLHGSTTAVVAILARDLTERHGSTRLHWFLPGLALAIGAHSLYNHLLLNPLLATVMLLFAMPLLVIVVFSLSERATRDWLGRGLDGDVERLEQLLNGEVLGSPVGEYMESIRHRFSGTVLADMLCLLRIHLELSIRAKGLLIARSVGVDLPPDPEVRSRLVEMDFLRRSIGPTGWLALNPLLRTSPRELWQINLLKA